MTGIFPFREGVERGQTLYVPDRLTIHTSKRSGTYRSDPALPPVAGFVPDSGARVFLKPRARGDEKDTKDLRRDMEVVPGILNLQLKEIGSSRVAHCRNAPP